MRIDEFSRNELRESHEELQELTSQLQELQERMIYMNDSKKFQDTESICCGKLSHVPSQPAVVPSSRSMLSREQSLRSDTWKVVWDTGKRFWQSTRSDRFITDTLSRNSSLFESKCYSWKPCAEEYRETCCERRRTNWKHKTNAELRKKTINHEFFLSSRSSTEFDG